jgi:hypothetical protein
MALARGVMALSLNTMLADEMLSLLIELKSLTRPQSGQTMADVGEMLKIYLKRLAPFPADVVRYVLTTQPEKSPWWPAWQELHERLEIHTYRRRMMFDALKVGGVK